MVEDCPQATQIDIGSIDRHAFRVGQPLLIPAQPSHIDILESQGINVRLKLFEVVQRGLVAPSGAGCPAEGYVLVEYRQHIVRIHIGFNGVGATHYHCEDFGGGHPVKVRTEFHSLQAHQGISQALANLHIEELLVSAVDHLAPGGILLRRFYPYSEGLIDCLVLVCKGKF